MQRNSTLKPKPDQTVETPATPVQWDDAAVLQLLAKHSYVEVSDKTGWSRGRIYTLALRSGARKTESRIRERHAERNERQMETLKEMLNKTTTADVLDFLAGIPDNSVKLHFTSTPYNIGKPYGDATGADAKGFTYFHGWLMQIVSEMARTLKEGGVLCLNLGKTWDWENKPYPMDVLLFEDLRRVGLTFQNRVIWPVDHGLTPKGRLAERYEPILVFSKGPQITFNPTPARLPQKHPGKRAFKGPNKGRLSGNPLGAHPTDVWSDIGHIKNGHPDRAEGEHPAQFPVALVRRAVLLYTLPGDLVCDVFRGSGSTPVACKETHRDFVGADLFYGDLAERRTNKAVPDNVSYLPGVSDATSAVWQAEARRVEQKASPISQAQEDALCEEAGIQGSLNLAI